MITPKAYYLCSQYHGSNKQLGSVAEHIFPEHETSALKVDLRTRAKLFFPFYELFIFLIGLFGADSHIAKFLKRIAIRGHIPVVNDSDVIVLKTPPFEYVALLLAAGSKAKLFYIGSPKRVKSERFGELISTPSTPCASATVMLDMLPTEKSYAEYRERSEVFQGSRYALLLLGGDAKGYHYQSDDWVKISNFVNNYSDITGIKWVISTSPRTGVDAEKILKSQIDKNACECFVCWGDGDRKTVFDCLTGAREVFVTHDSASMISEAINVRLPTIVIRPDKTEYNSLTVPLVDHMVSKRAAMDIKCSDLSLESVGEWKNKEFKPINKCWVEAWERGD